MFVLLCLLLLPLPLGAVVRFDPIQLDTCIKGGCWYPSLQEIDDQIFCLWSWEITEENSYNVFSRRVSLDGIPLELPQAVPAAVSNGHHCLPHAVEFVTPDHGRARLISYN
jgi:hypothetical protein